LPAAVKHRRDLTVGAAHLQEWQNQQAMELQRTSFAA